RKDVDLQDNIKPTLNLQAYNYESNERIKTKKAFETDDLLLVRLTDVDENIRFIDLKIDEEKGEDDLEIEGNNTEDIEEDTEISTEDKYSSVILFGDYRKIKTNNNLKNRDEKGYKIMFIENDITNVKNDIKNIKEDQIPKINKRIIQLENDIKVMEKDLKYQTDEDKLDLESDIKGKKNKI